METWGYILAGLAITWFGAIGIALVKSILKLERTLVRYDGQFERHEERLDGHEVRLNKHSKQIFNAGRVSYLLLIVAVFMMVTLSGCSLLGLDMDQAQADAEETASALQIVNDRLPAIEASIDSLVALYDAAIERGDFDEAKRLAVAVRAEVKKLELTTAEQTELTDVFNKRVAEFRAAKDTRGYLQAALGLFGGAFMTFFGGRKVAGRRNRLIKAVSDSADNVFGAGNSTESEEFKTEIKSRLNQSDQALLDKLRKA